MTDPYGIIYTLVLVISVTAGGICLAVGLKYWILGE